MTKKQGLTQWILEQHDTTRSDRLLTYGTHGLAVLRFALILTLLAPFSLIGYLARKWTDPLNV